MMPRRKSPKKNRAFEGHHRFHHPFLAGQLAAAIAQALAEMEETESYDTPNDWR
mgnify:CR=1 FL=1